MKTHTSVAFFLLFNLGHTLVESWEVRTTQNSRRSFLKNSVSVVAVLSASPSTVSVAATSEEVPQKPAESPGVIWNARQGMAMPATPSTLNNIIQREWLGIRNPSQLAGRNEPSKESEISPCNSGILCIGERHDDFAHHVVQLRCIMSLRSALEKQTEFMSPQFSAGMECFHRQHDPFLDKFITDDSYSLQDLRKDTSWDGSWGYDLLHYAPILLYAKSKRIRLFGLHPTDEEVDAVFRNGLDHVPNRLARGVQSKDEVTSHYKNFMEFMGIDSGEMLERNPSLQEHVNRLYLVQCFREEFMAESVVLHQEKSKSQRTKQQQGHWSVVLAGENHVATNGSIPTRLARQLSEARRNAKVQTTDSIGNRLENAGNPWSDDISAGSSSQGSRQVGTPAILTLVPRTIGGSSTLLLSKGPSAGAAVDYTWFVQNDQLKPDQVNPAPFSQSLTALG